MECLLPRLSMVTVSHIANGRIRENVGLKRCRIREVSLYYHRIAHCRCLQKCLL